MKQKRIRWTPELINQLRSLYQDNHNLIIAERMGLSESSIKAKATVLGLKKNGKHKVRTSPYLRIDIEEFKKLYPTTTIKALIEKYGGSESGIISLAKEHNLK
mgnify:CR=1 FL=1